MLFYNSYVMRDLIRNYRMLIKGKTESDSDAESQPLMSSGSSSRSQSFGSIPQTIFKQDSDTDLDTTQKFAHNVDIAPIPPVLLQKKLNRRFLYPSSYQTPELEEFETINDDYDYNNSEQEIVSEKNGHKSTIGGRDYDYSDPEPSPEATHSSLVTIFAIWNTTVGTSLLAMAWGIEKTGLFPSIFINILIAAICLYTTNTLLKINDKHGVIGRNGEVCDLCKDLLGRWAEILAKIFSLVVLIGANIVYWILMSNFFYNSVHFLYGTILQMENNTVVPNQTVICPKNETLIIPHDTSSGFHKFWDLYSTVPIILGIVMFPLLNWKSPTFFTKFNSLGTFSILFLIVFVATKAMQWGINMKDWKLEFYLKPTFFALSGMLSLSYFIHNIIISVMRNNRYQEKNGRDLSIAFGLVTFTYLFLGIVFYISFPLPKACIEDNILNNFDKYDSLTIIARILLLFQLFTVFPLISYMLRNDIFANINMIFKNYRFGDFTYGRVIILNFGIVLTCILFACFLPRIGTLIRYTGALSGMVYIFMLPSLLKIASLRKEGALTYPQLIFHGSIMVLGGLNLICQFFITDN